MAFTQRAIEATFQLANTSFVPGVGPPAPGGANTATVKGLRMSAQIVKGGTFAATAHMRIWGMQLSLMNQLSTLGQQVKLVQANSLTINAGDPSLGALPAIFTGTIMSAWIDFAAQPQVAFDVTANSSGFEAINTIKGSSFPQGSDVITFMTQLAGQMNIALENSGVPATPISPNSYFPGSAWDQVVKAKTDYNFNAVIDLGKLAIWPKDGTRSIPNETISKATGMIVSPIYTATGLIIKSLFNGNVSIGSNITVQSDVATPANGTWGVLSISHDIETNVPKGQWFSTIEAYSLAFPTPMAVAP